MDSTIYVVNQSTQVSDADVQTMTAACAKQIFQHIAPAHGLNPVSVVFLTKGTQAPTTQARIITVQDTLDDPQALGYHTEDGSEHIWGVVGTSAAISQGGAQALTGPYAISTILSHEIAEMFYDPFCSGWFDSGQGYLVAAELGDPVQSDLYQIDNVAVSNFVTPEWFNPMPGPGAKFDYLGNLTGPFTMSSGGYLVSQTDGQTSQKFRDRFPEWLKQQKMNDVSRARRLEHSRPSAAV